jgi:hypothetical protein
MKVQFWDKAKIIIAVKEDLQLASFFFKTLARVCNLKREKQKI